MALSLVNQYHPLLPVQANKPSSSSSSSSCSVFLARHFQFQPKLKFASHGIRCFSPGSAFTDKTLVSIKPNNLNHVPNDDTLACRFHTAQYGAQESDKSYVEAYAIGRNIRMSADKARRVIDQIRGRSYEETLTVLELMPYRACEAIIKIVFSAGANASNNLGLSKGSLIISKAEVNEGKTMKRIRPQSRGRAYPIRKRTCHIAITVRGLPSKSVEEANPA